MRSSPSMQVKDIEGKTVSTEPLADASDERAKTPAPDPASASEISKAVAELKAFVRALKKRKDITVTVAAIGRKAGKSKLAQLRAQRAPDELVELYAEVDGVHVEWRFVEPPGGGCMRIPPVTQWTRFGDDESTYMNFGDDREALLLDEVTPEGNTWLVRDKDQDGDEATIIFASAAEGADGIIAASSIAEYLRKAMGSGFVGYWPRCFEPSPYVSYAEQEQTIERFRAKPVAPSKIAVGARVQFEFFAEGGRGKVLANHSAAASEYTEFPGTSFAQVELDEGSTAWIPHKWLKVYKQVDAYERLRAADFDLEAAAQADIIGLLDDLIRAIDPLGHYTMRDDIGRIPSNARRAAGLLATRPFVDAVKLALALEDALPDDLDRRQSRTLAKTGDEFAPAELARFRWSYTVRGLLEGLFGGLVILAHHESARREVPGNTLVDKRLLARLDDIDEANELHERCTRKGKLAEPVWGLAGDELGPKYGLPSGAAVWLGSGF